MKKSVMVAIVAMLGFMGSVSAQNIKDTAGIVTPDVATGMYRTYRFTHDASQNFLICKDQFKFESSNLIGHPADSCKDSNNKAAWVHIKDAVPAGKRYVGFKSVSQGNHHMLEIYWADK